MSPLKVVDELRDQAEELLGVLVRSLAELDLEGGGKDRKWVCRPPSRPAAASCSVAQLLLVPVPEAGQHNQLISSISG